MKKRETIFYVIVGLVLFILVGSEVFGFKELHRATQNKIIILVWAILNVVFQGPVLLVPLDRGRILGLLNRALPQLLFLGLVSWNLSQITFLLLSPFILMIPSGPPLLGFLLCWPVGIYFVVFKSARKIVKRQFDLTFEHLPPDWKPLRILHLSDIHAGPFMKESQLRRIVSRLNRDEFDLCLITGDIVNHSSREMAWVLPVLEDIKTHHGIFASMGNHEYIDNEDLIIEAYSKSKIKLLLNSSDYISKGSTRVRLVGVDFPFDTKLTTVEEIKNAMQVTSHHPQNESELVLLLSHHPIGFDAAEALGISLTLSGHTHGGQIQIGRKNLVSSFNKYVRGLYQKGKSSLYVNSGLGNWMPFRIGVPCEYAVITVESSRGNLMQ